MCSPCRLSTMTLFLKLSFSHLFPVPVCTFALGTQQGFFGLAWVPRMPAPFTPVFFHYLTHKSQSFPHLLLQSFADRHNSPHFLHIFKPDIPQFPQSCLSFSSAIFPHLSSSLDILPSKTSPSTFRTKSFRTHTRNPSNSISMSATNRTIM